MHNRKPRIRSLTGAACTVMAACSFCCSALVGAQTTQTDHLPANYEIAPGPFEPDWESLKKYEFPDWYRDAKFGIWAHWSAQCVPEQGDWYAKHMYEQGHRQYQYHLSHYGHPARFGFKDICGIWKVDQWDPDWLIRLYRRAGAKYFVGLANHHCNFDCWDSKHQPWNSVRVGPHRDLVGEWAQAARRHGLRFGVTVHCARAWNWYETSQGSDKTGPFAGMPYDGTLTKADGKGLWWEGLDPQDLYAQNHKPGAKPNKAYVDKFFNRVKDLIDSYQPDLLYFDDHLLPLYGVSDVGLYIAAHLYNSSTRWHGRNEAVLNTKGVPADLRGALVWDIERGRTGALMPHPWQTDTCIGNWHYKRDITYKTPQTVITTLVDIVSKNGNLLLNIPVRGNGSIDEQEQNFLIEMENWMDVNGQAIFGTRPWLIYGEGRAERGGSFSERRQRSYTARDVRFTRKGDVLYAFILGWPDDGQAVIRSLGANSPLVTGEITELKLLGHSGRLSFRRTEDGLRIQLPPEKPCEHAFTFRIRGLQPNPNANLDEQPWLDTSIEPNAKGVLNLTAEVASLHGSRINTERKGRFTNIGYWDNAKEWVSWPKVKVREPGVYRVTMFAGTIHPQSAFMLRIGDHELTGKVTRTGAWDKFQDFHVGEVRLQAGTVAVELRPADAGSWKAINVVRVRLKKK